MNRRGFNKLKEEILELLLRKKENISSQALSTSLGTHLTNTSNCLGRLARYGLVDRRAVNIKRRGRPRYVYSINSRGKKRLKFWASNSKECY